MYILLIVSFLDVEHLVDELEADPEKYSRDCQVYYVRDDYIARKVSSASTFLYPQNRSIAK